MTVRSKVTTSKSIILFALLITPRVWAMGTSSDGMNDFLVLGFDIDLKETDPISDIMNRNELGGLQERSTDVLKSV